MGTFAKRLGQVTARSLESESKNILKTSAANKVPGSLSLALDGTLREGHNMRVFGIGTIASMADRARYARFTASMHAVYSAMEAELDATCAKSSPAVHSLWARHGNTLRRAPALRLDLADVVEDLDGAVSTISPATKHYVQGIHEAGVDDRASGGARMFGHVYCRYFADLFGGSVLASPTRAALSLPKDTPRHYAFDLPAAAAGQTGTGDGRRAFIEEVYSSFNEVGEMLDPEDFSKVVAESRRAFQFNVGVYGEEPMIYDAMRGSFNIVTGYVAQTVRGA
ncbi:unnamed protein product [Polarella glacialis]|uniref:Heme oxygenase n=1 Tax=Polarella glacialis TaxID=89957 RepID=A0A813EKC0_POLGL|nr:unnamed protein product [Polarella glacialis]CAE8724333.1 unnamed protein product [Polarella glacialis]